MKVAQNDETNPETKPIRPPHIPSIANTQLFPFGSFVRKCETPGILSRMFPPFLLVSPTAALGHPLAPRFIMLCFVMPCVLHIYYFSRSSSPVDLETDIDASEYDYVNNDPSLPE